MTRDVAVDATPAALETSVYDDDLDHVTCCLDADLALCGTDVADANWIGDDDPLSCGACIAADEAGTCPRTKVCRFDGGAA